MTYAFTFDARFCSGCKACQAACKDKNNLPPGVLWRRVFEVTGGTWQQNGEAWNTNVFAYNLSIACNHCLHPKCAGICPAKAYVVRDDGIVLLDEAKCIGCGYCSWACPYGAPQYNPVVGRMSKCNLCFDQLEQGLPPACVAACPLRVLGYRETTTELTSNEIRLWNVPSETHPYPLPGYSHTQPRLAIRPHVGMATKDQKFVANVEEIQPRLPSRWEDLPLILFTLLGQMAVGGFWALLWMFPAMWASSEQQITLAGLLPYLLVGVFFGSGALASFAHLGTKKRALFALRNLRRSWLSREILFTGLFGVGFVITLLEIVIWHRNMPELFAITAVLGLGLVHSMAKVYRLPSIPAWNNWRTNAVFILSALLLGQSAMAVLLGDPPIYATGSILILLLAQLGLIHKQVIHDPFIRVRAGLILTAMALSMLGLFSASDTWLSILIFLIVLFEEGLGRFSFYQAGHRIFSPSIAER